MHNNIYSSFDFGSGSLEIDIGLSCLSTVSPASNGEQAVATRDRAIQAHMAGVICIQDDERRNNFWHIVKYNKQTKLAQARSPGGPGGTPVH